MAQRDYILRVIEQAARIVAELRRRILGGEVVDMEKEVRSVIAHAGLDFSMIRALDPTSILSMLSPAGDPDPTQVWLIAELLYLDGLAARQSDSVEEARMHFAKARVLYGALDHGVLASTVPEAAARMAELDELLQDIDE